DIGQFEPMGPEDEYAAECETEVCNWYLQSKNDFYSHIVATLTDALLLKNGYIAGMWTTRSDVKVERKKADEFVGIESIPPDEMLVSRRHRWTSVADADFVQWRRRVTIGQLRAEGFKVPDDVEEYSDYGTEKLGRDRFDQDRVFNDETPDPSRKVVLFKDTYLRIDLQGKGEPQLWRIAYVAGMTKPCLKEEADLVPF